MIYKILISPRAQLEIVEIINYYFSISNSVRLKFDKRLEETFDFLKTNPYFPKRYKDFRTITLKGFPYLLFYTINEDEKFIRILSCFHTSKNPTKYPK
jgi:toxin ParE1/3/4